MAPALVLNYFGQGALLMADPKALENPFYLAFPPWALYPMVALATAATVIASQATISGAYSMTQQAIQLGFLPRMTVLHTSARTMGQIYVPLVNWILLGAVAVAVIGFGSSSRLASAYGVSVMGTMLATTFLTFFVIRFAWGYPLWLSLAATGFFLVVDASFLAAALHKVLDGGWFPILLGAAIFGVMMTWRRGRRALLVQLRTSSVPLVALPRFAVPVATAARAGNRGVPHRDARCHAACAAAQPQALQGAARAQRVHDRRVPRRALGAVRAAGELRARSDTIAGASPCATAS